MQTSQPRTPQLSIDVLNSKYLDVRAQTKTLTTPLSAEDQVVQSMPDASPTKWHLAHTTWFFETFILKPHLRDYRIFQDSYNYLFNSYYERVGPRHARPMRGLLTRPSLDDVHAYRDHVDDAMTEFLSSHHLTPGLMQLIELGCHHEQQHQELLLTDIKHLLSCNPMFPTYATPRPREADRTRDLVWIGYEGGLMEVGTNGPAFHFDCEGPRHKVWLEPFRFASRLVTNGEFIDFIEDGGYERPELWLSEGWAAVQTKDWRAPLYWVADEDHGWRIFTLLGLRPIYLDVPVCHISYYEADAFARWSGKRLPTEAEWEAVAVTQSCTDGHFVGSEAFHPLPAQSDGIAQIYGDVWEWTVSAFGPYPGFKPVESAVGEYNGKFMSGQMVLRGGSCVTPDGHLRTTYRNFFHPTDRWQFSGLRLADDLERPAAVSVSFEEDDTLSAAFLRDVLCGLGSIPKSIPPKWFYDADGSSLFTEICGLEAYYQTRTEMGILKRNAKAIAAAIGPEAMLIEYGAGVLDKVRPLLHELSDPVALTAVDISAEQLTSASDRLREKFPNIEVLKVVADFAGPHVLPEPARIPKTRVVFFPGSTIGNFEPDDAIALLRKMHRTVGARGGLLIGIDLKKSPEVLVAAYDDPEGVTAAFNKNLLRRMQNELGADLRAELFRHVVRYDTQRGRIEMHLESLVDQTIKVGGEIFTFRPGESIHTENSYKYIVDEFVGFVAEAGFSVEAYWQDDNGLFAEIFFRA